MTDDRIVARVQQGSARCSASPHTNRRRRSHTYTPPTEHVKSDNADTNTITSDVTRFMLPTRPLPLLICSIGNPGSQYANTLHSAGHTVLNLLAQRLGSPPFHKDRTHGNGLLSRLSPVNPGEDWTLWQSTSFMNDSGKGVRAAYMAWSKNIPDGEGKLVIVHDELEKPLGAVSLRTTQGASAKGHNGLKSIMSHIGNTPFVRIGVGIGRPVSRSSDDVARYVLKKMDPTERAAMEASIDQVIAKLRQVQASR